MWGYTPLIRWAYRVLNETLNTDVNIVMISFLDEDPLDGDDILDSAPVDERWGAKKQKKMQEKEERRAMRLVSNGQLFVSMDLWVYFHFLCMLSSPRL